MYGNTNSDNKKRDSLQTEKQSEVNSAAQKVQHFFRRHRNNSSSQSSGRSRSVVDSVNSTALWSLARLRILFGSRYTKLSVFFLTVYVVLGVGYFHGYVQYSILDALYFCVTTALTIGYGDIVPVSPAQRQFTCWFIIFGMLSSGVRTVCVCVCVRYLHSLLHINDGVTQCAGGAGKSERDS